MHSGRKEWGGGKHLNAEQQWYRHWTCCTCASSYSTSDRSPIGIDTPAAVARTVGRFVGDQSIFIDPANDLANRHPALPPLADARVIQWGGGPSGP